MPKVRKYVWHDGSSKGAVHKNKRHDCWRADCRVYDKIDGKTQMIARKRKRFKNYDEAWAWLGTLCD